MAQRNAHARAAPPPETVAEEQPTLLSAAQEQAGLLKQQLLDSTQAAADAILTETRAQGERKIEESAQRAQAIAQAVSAIEAAACSLTERTRAFVIASEALRDQLGEFGEALAQGEREVSAASAGEPGLRLVTGGAAPQTPPHPPSGAESGDEEADNPPGEDDVEDEVPEPGDPEPEAGDDDLGSNAEGMQLPLDGEPREPEHGKHGSDEVASEVDDDEKDDEDDLGEPPSRAEIEEFIRDHEGSERGLQPERGRPGGHGREVRTTSTFDVLGGVNREFLAVQLGGALLGLTGTIALLRFVIL